MQDVERRLLSKPIKFYNEMEELFKGSHADGSLAMDQERCLDDDKGSDSDDSGGLNDIYLVMHIELTLKVMTPTHYPHLKVLKLVLTMKVVEKIAQRAHVDLERSDQEGSSRLVRSPQSLRVVLQMPLKTSAQL